MRKTATNVFTIIMLSLLPLLLRCTFDMLLAIQIDYKNYFPEIYMFNLVIFAYNYNGIINNKHSFRTFKYIILCMGLPGFLLSTIVYVSSFHNQLKLTIIVLIADALINVILTVINVMTVCEEDDDSYYQKNIHEKYSENRYERYLLERIDEKLNIIKNPKIEKTEKESDDTKNSEELLNGSDILAEMLKNHIEIKEYFRISKNQSRFSFYFSIVSSVAGIIVVIIAAAGIVIFENLGISIIAAVSGAITEVISGIVLWIHNKSALQLNYYYDSLHENEKFLSAVNIADKLSEEKKEDMYIEIIRKQIDIQSKDKGNDASNTDSK